MLTLFGTYDTLDTVKEKTVNVRLRLPQNLHAKHKAIAAMEKVTLHRWLVDVLKAYVLKETK